MSPVRRTTMRFLRPYRRQIAVAAAGIIGATLIAIAGPLLVKYAIDNGIEKSDMSVVNEVALVYLGLVVLRPLLERAIVLASARAGERFLGDLRVSAFEKLQASAHKLAEAMYKSAGAEPPPAGEGGEPPPAKDADVIDAEFEDKS